MKKSLIFLFVFIINHVWAENITLDEILEYATGHALLLKIKKSEIEIETKNIVSAKSEYFPKIDALYNTEYTKSLDGTPLGTESVGGITISNGTRYQNTAVLQLNYNLYHFGTTDRQVAIASANRAIKKKEWCLEEKNLHQQIARVYTDALKRICEKKYKLQMISIRKKMYETGERLYKAGQYSKMDLGSEAMAIIELERDIESAAMQYKEDILQLSKLSYMELKPDTRLLPLVGEKVELSRTSYEETPEAEMLEKKILQKRDEISLAAREQLPSIALYSNYYLYSSHPKQAAYPILHIGQKSWNIGFSVRFNLFNGFKNSAYREKLFLELQNLQYEYEAAKHTYEHKIESAYSKIDELTLLHKKEKSLLAENKNSLSMVIRLRKNRQVDIMTRLNTEYRLLERHLNMEIRGIEVAFEKVMLKITGRGVNRCTLH